MTDETGEKLPNAGRNGNVPPVDKQFKKGYDPRRNLRGVPKDAIEARKFFRKIGAELLTIKEKDANGESVEYDITRLEAAVRLKFGSRAPKDFETILKAMFPGLLKDEVDVTSGGERIEPIDNERFARAFATLADALRESVSGKRSGENSKVDTAK